MARTIPTAHGPAVRLGDLQPGDRFEAHPVCPDFTAHGVCTYKGNGEYKTPSGYVFRTGTLVLVRKVMAS